jgi:TPR repeat protein
MRQIIKLFLLIVLVSCFNEAHSQKVYKYSAADKLALTNANKKIALLADHKLSDQQAYALGMEYERIYNKYRDTSMPLAVKCFEYYCWEENEYSFTAKQKQVAYKLGGIYEKGTGIARDTVMAITWYKLSTPAGNTRSQSLQTKFCKAPLSLQSEDEKIDPQQAKYKLLSRATLALLSLPSCRYTKEQIASVMGPVAEAMKEAPHLVLWIDHSISDSWNSTHTWNVKKELKRVKDAAAYYLVEKIGISAERIKGAPFETTHEGKKGASVMEFRLITFDELDEMEKGTLPKQ